MAIRDQIATTLSMRLPLPAILEREVTMPVCLSRWVGTSFNQRLSNLMAKFGRYAQRRPFLVSRRHATIERTPQNNSFRLAGNLALGKDGLYLVDGVAFLIDQETWVVGALKTGSLVRVRGILVPSGKRLATKVTSIAA